MALGQIDATEIPGADSTGATIEFATPPAANDIIMLVFSESDDDVPTITPPTGFEQYFSFLRESGSIFAYIDVWWKRAGASEGTSYSISYPTQFVNRGSLIGVTFTGRATSGNPFDGTEVRQQGFGGNINAPSFTPSVDGCDILHWYAEQNWGAGDTVSPPAGYTIIPAAPSLFADQAGATLEQATAAATGTQSISGGGGGWIAASFALLPETSQPVTRVQVGDSYANPPSALFPATPTEGSILIAQASGRSGQTSLTMQSAGWTKIFDHPASQADTTYRRILSVWYKVAGPAESTTVALTNTGGDVLLSIAEYSIDSRFDTWTLEDYSVDDDGNTTNGDNLSSGATASIGNTPMLLVGLGMAKNFDGCNTCDDMTNLANELAHCGGGEFGLTNGLAFAQDDTTGTKATAIDWGTNQRVGIISAIAVFSMSAAGEPPPGPSIAAPPVGLHFT